MADTELNIGPDEKIAGVPLARLLRNLDETSYNEGSEALACRLTDCKAVIEELLAGRSTPPSPSTAPEVSDLMTYPSPHGTLVRLADVMCRISSANRAAPASRPAEVDDEGLPPLPKRMVPGSIMARYSAEQFRQGQRDAVAADRARREKGGA